VNALSENLEPNEPGEVGPTSQNYCHLIKWGDCFCEVWDGETCLSCLHADCIFRSIVVTVSSAS
jgi:hypothetical protein